jgi:hypothetical protein
LILFPLFHWSPTERRDSIRRDGLQPYSEPTVTARGEELVAFPYVALSQSPSRAWSLSGDMEWLSEIESWDLWQVGLTDEAEVHVRPFWGDTMDELQVYTPIPAEKVWYVATRHAPEARKIKRKGAKK